MATETLQAESACANAATVYSLYNAWQHARAKWHIVLYAPEYADEDVPDEINNPLSAADSEAFDRFMRAPAQSAGDLSRKLTAFRDEDGYELTHAAAYLAILAEDARRLR